jgi:hypothetical protein
MITRDYEAALKDLLEEYCLFLVESVFVKSVHDWCRENSEEEPDKEKPLRLVAHTDNRGCKLVINELIPDKVVEGRINALSVRSALTNVASNKADLLDSDKKKLAFLFLAEYASALPDLEDEILQDQWVFQEMERLGFFKE